MAMTLRLTDEQTEALRRRAEKEGRSMQQVVVAAVEEYLARHTADEEVHRLGAEAVRRWKPVLDRLAQ
ncbi:ribbon-helix-helix protein, CopG family [Microbispora bryophytorum]|uniref:ribbon-helix-helix protein, CopG family n=1 Tax=Microbispora bryophytorum TaxID=1460882 RepID=UPI0033FEF321